MSEKELQDIVDATYIRGYLRYGICRLRELVEEKELTHLGNLVG